MQPHRAKPNDQRGQLQHDKVYLSNRLGMHSCRSRKRQLASTNRLRKCWCTADKHQYKDATFQEHSIYGTSCIIDFHLFVPLMTSLCLSTYISVSLTDCEIGRTDERKVANMVRPFCMLPSYRELEHGDAAELGWERDLTV